MTSIEKENKIKLFANSLLQSNIIGDLRTEDDLEIAKFHSKVAIEFCKLVVTNFIDNIDENIFNDELFEKFQEEISKYVIK